MTLWHRRYRKFRRFARDDILVRVAFNLVSLRRQRRWTQAKLGRRLGLPVSVIRALEIAQLSFTLAAFEKIVDALGLSARDLLSPIPARLRTVAMRAVLRRSWNDGYSPGWQYSPRTPRTLLLSEPRPVKAGWRHGPSNPRESQKRNSSTIERSSSDAAGPSNALRLTTIRERLRFDSTSHFVYRRRPISLGELSHADGSGVTVTSLLLPFQRDRHRVVLTALRTATGEMTSHHPSILQRAP
jgi:transcriptional regulator with XRE-family HTH domain